MLSRWSGSNDIGGKTVTDQVDPVVAVIGSVRTVARVRAAAPGWRVIETARTADELHPAGRRRARLDLIVVEVGGTRHDIMTCVQLRAEVPTVPVLPLTHDPEPADALARLGCAPPLSIVAPDHALRESLSRALRWRSEAAPLDPVVTYLRRLERDKVPEPLSVVVLASSDVLRVGLRELAVMAGGRVHFDTTSPEALTNVLSKAAVRVLVADSGALEAAEAVARRFRIPLLVGALTWSAGYRALRCAKGVLLEPIRHQTLAVALDAVAAGGRFCDGALEDPFRDTPLTPTERRICLSILEDKRSGVIARELSMQQPTVRWHLSNIYSKLGVDGPDAIRRWVDGAQHRRRVADAAADTRRRGAAS
jgi:DNA-binding NarL/FixJ family response regulator